MWDPCEGGWAPFAVAGPTGESPAVQPPEFLPGETARPRIGEESARLAAERMAFAANALPALIAYLDTSVRICLGQRRLQPVGRSPARRDTGQNGRIQIERPHCCRDRPAPHASPDASSPHVTTRHEQNVQASSVYPSTWFVTGRNAQGRRSHALGS